MYTQNAKHRPYWWEAAPPDAAPADTLPKQVDILVIGSGYTGLHAALRTARAGRHTHVIDAEHPGFGASTRNGGQISTSLKPSQSALMRRYGRDLGTALAREGQASLDYMKSFMAEEPLECDFQVPGRFHAAHSARHYEKLAKSCASPDGEIKSDAFMVPRAQQHSELGTDAYHGGIVFPHHASLHPGRYHAGLLKLVRAEGVGITGHCAATAIDRLSDGFRVTTAQGEIKARRVILATNGYTGPLASYQQRRIIPIGSYIIATEELAPEQMDQIMPTNRVLSDTRKLVYYYRPSPDRKHILFGGRVSLRETNTLNTGLKLRHELIRLFPQLSECRIAHSWTGFVGYTFDSMMHCGEQDGLFFAMGYCGSGVGMASYLGMKIGLMAADDPRGTTAFAQIPFPTRPFYQGNPWFLAPSVLAYRLWDRTGF